MVECDWRVVIGLECFRLIGIEYCMDQKSLW